MQALKAGARHRGGFVAPVEMEKNYTLEPWEVEKGFVLTCQSRPLTDRLVVSYDER